MNDRKLKIYLIKAIVCFFIFAPLGHSQSLRNWLHEGDNFFKQSNFQQALNSYNLYVEDNPNDPRGYLHRARLNAAIGNTNASQIDFKLAENINPLSHMYLDANLRSNYYVKKFYDYNMSEADESFSKSPLRMKDYLGFIDSIVSNHNADSLIIEAIQNIADRDFTDAAISLDEIQTNPSNIPLIHDLKGLIKLKTGDIDAAINHFTKAIEYDPYFAIAYHNRAICFKLQKRFEEAKVDLKRAISINDELPIFYFTFAKLNQKTENIDQAKKNYQKALDIDEDYIEASANYRQLLKSIGDYDSSLLYLSDLSSLNLESSEQHFLKANLHFVYGEFEDAMYHMDEYLSEFPDDMDALYNLGLIKILLREYDEGCECISRSLEKNTNQKRIELYESYCSDIFK